MSHRHSFLSFGSKGDEEWQRHGAYRWDDMHGHCKSKLTEHESREHESSAAKLGIARKGHSVHYWTCNWLQQSALRMMSVAMH